jgi:hypothetical protein
VTVDEALIRDVFLRLKAGDLDQVLTAIEGYRVCVSAWRKLRRTRRLREQAEEVKECAESCEKALLDYVATGCWKEFQYPPAGREPDFQTAHLVLMLPW